VNPQPVGPTVSSIATIDTSFCGQNNGGINNISVSGGTAPYSFEWYSNLLLVGTNSALTNVGSGNYSLVVTDQSGCSATSAVMNIPAAGGITVAITGNPTSGLEPLSTTIFATTSVPSSSNAWYLNNSLLANETGSSINLNNLSQGTYITSIIVMDSYGCVDTADIEIVVDPNIVIPNVFTPNGDNTNDVFFINQNGFKQMHLEIFDRWGIKLWEVESLNPSWDGRTTAGIETPDGTYYYILNTTDKNDRNKIFTGYVLLGR
jgi:gliding motility-associated-like protein